jgi:flavodoxin
LVGRELLKTAVIIYWSKTGNTKKVAYTIKEGLVDAGFEVSLKKTEEAGDIDYFDYDLVCIGFPSYEWHPPKPMTDLLKNNLNKYRKEGKVKLCAPKIPGKNVLIFCTYSGPHTGIDEASPACKYVRQFFEHIGFTVIDELYILSEFHGWEEGSTKGKMGDIRGKPSDDDLRDMKKDVIKLAGKL